MRLALSHCSAAVVAACFITGLAATPAAAQVALPPSTEELRTVVSAQRVLDEFGGLQIE